ncbi:MAG: hypothetical protein IH960_08815 [Chloroflexi bacterium]|nr:hypothetical protein [Chloroflexota bacterium]MCH8230649.1 hypothetical protein [Chloroflexota bacterium]
MPIGSITVATPGTAVAVATSGNAITAVSFRARTDNTGAVYVGDSGVSSSNGYRLEPGDELNLSFRETIDLRRFFVDADTANDAVDFAGVAA